MTLYKGVWGRPGVIFGAPPEALDMQMDEHLVGVKLAGYEWVAFDIYHGEWRAERYRCRALRLEAIPYRDITSIMDVALLVETRRRWPGCTHILPRVVTPHTRDYDLVRAVYAHTRELHCVGVITDCPYDRYGEWPRRMSAGIAMLEWKPGDNIRDACAEANKTFYVSIPVLPADRGLVRADFDWRTDRPHVVSHAEKVTDWMEWDCETETAPHAGPLR